LPENTLFKDFFAFGSFSMGRINAFIPAAAALLPFIIAVVLKRETGGFCQV